MVDSSLSIERAASKLRNAGPVPEGLEPRIAKAAAVSDCQLDLRFFPAPPDLDGCFTTFYRMELTVPDGETVVDYLQPEWGNLRFFSNSTPDCRIDGSAPLVGADFVATGPSSVPLRFQLGTTRMWGVGLFPYGWARFIGLPANEFANCAVNGAHHPAFKSFASLPGDLFGGEPDDLAEYAMLIDAFRARILPVRDEKAIRAVHAAMVDVEMVSVVELAARAGMTARSLERLCLRHFGFPPKLLLCRQRLMRTVSAYMVDQGKNWSKVIDGRYHDQAHFVREFQQFMQMTPREYASLGHPVLAAFMAERKRILGSPAQTLDRP